MTLLENPIFLTQKRLVHRDGIFAGILIAALIGLSLLSGLIAYQTDPRTFGFSSVRQAGKVFYGWTVGVEALVLVFGSFSRISRSLTEDRKAGLWDINRLTPLSSPQLVAGYWLGSALREVYMAAVLAVLGLVIVILGELPLTLWLGTQILLLGAVLFFGLLGVLSGMAFQRSNAGVFLVLCLAAVQIFSLGQPRLILTSFLLPVDPMIHLFVSGDSNLGVSAWVSMPSVFGISLEPVLLTLVLQAVLGLLFWRAAVHRTSHPFTPLLRRGDAIAIFGVLSAAQEGLLWNLWRGQFGQLYGGRFDVAADGSSLSMAFCGILILGIVLLAFSSPQPERVRVETLRTGTGNALMIWSRSAVSLALALWAVACVSLWPHFLFSMKSAGAAFAVAALNWLDCFLIFCLWLEFCRLEFRRRALGFVAVGLFVLCILPLILGLVFGNAGFCKLSLLAPGVLALNEQGNTDIGLLLHIVLAHTALVAVLGLAWRHQWKRFLTGARA